LLKLNADRTALRDALKLNADRTALRDLLENFVKLVQIELLLLEMS